MKRFQRIFCRDVLAIDLTKRGVRKVDFSLLLHVPALEIWDIKLAAGAASCMRSRIMRRSSADRLRSFSRATRSRNCASASRSLTP
jgi:hypothetical protein